MSGSGKSILGQLVVLVVLMALAFTVLMRTEMVTRFSYLVEKGRLQARRESMPVAAEVDPWNAQARAVAEVVAPAVVQIVIERKYDLASQSRSDIIRDLLGLGRDEDAGEPRDIDTNALILPDNDAHRKLWEKGKFRVEAGYGSGFIVDADNGYIVTNNHVIDRADVIRV